MPHQFVDPVTSRRPGRLLFLAMVVFAGAETSAQRNTIPPLEPGTSAILGRVIESPSGIPVMDCEIALNSTRAFRKRTTTTDVTGSFAFEKIADGEYSLMATCTSHLQTCYVSPESRPRCANLSVVADQRRNNADLSVIPGAVARGRVVDTTGAAVSKAVVRLGMPFHDSSALPAMPTVTRPDGSFELINLPPGEWRVEVELPDTPDGTRLPIVYYPGVVARDEAAGIQLKPSHITNDVTIVVPRFRQNKLTIRLNPSRDGMGPTAVSLIRAAPLMTRQLDLDANGTGSASGLSEGTYFVTARAQYRTEPWVAFDVIRFTGDTNETSLQMHRAGRITGKIIAERGGLPPLDGVSVAAAWVHEGAEINPLVSDEAEVAPDGGFTIDGLFGSRHLQVIGLHPDWRVRSILHGRTDVSGRALEVALDAATAVTVVLDKK